MKKLMASLLSVVLVLSLSAPLALAEEPTGETEVVVEAGTGTEVETSTDGETEPGAEDESETEAGTVTEESETETGEEAETDTEVTDPAPEAGITPDSWFYSFDRALEQVQLFLAQGEVAKAAILEKLAAERLAEAEKMIGADQQALAQQMLTEFTATLKAITENLEAASLGTSSTADDEQLVQLIGSVQALREGFQQRVSEILQKLDESLADDPTDAIDEAEDTADAIDDLNGEKEESKLVAAIVNVYGLDEDLFEQLSAAGLNFGQAKMIAILMGRVNQNKAEGEDLLTVEEAVAVYKQGWGQLKKEYGLKSGELGLAIGKILKESKATPVDDGTADEQAEEGSEVEETEQNTLSVTTKAALEVKTEHKANEQNGKGQAKGKNK